MVDGKAETAVGPGTLEVHVTVLEKLRGDVGAAVVMTAMRHENPPQALHFPHLRGREVGGQLAIFADECLQAVTKGR